MAFISLNNARGLHIENAERADAANLAEHSFRYRGATIETLRVHHLDLTACTFRPRVSVAVTLPGDVVAQSLVSQRPLATHAEAAGYAMGAADTLLAERVEEEGRYRQVQRRFHQLGRQVYGADWDEARAAFVRAYTDDRSTSSTVLGASELQFFIGRWETLLAERAESAGASVPARLAA